MESINYTEKILTFNLLVGNSDGDKALNYLTKANWDETKAAILYNKDKESKIKKSSFYDYYDYKPISNTNRINNINNNSLLSYSNVNRINNINNNSLLSYSYNNINNINNYSNFNDILFGSKNEKTKVDLQKLNTFPECPIFEKKFIHNFAIFKVDNNKYYRKFSFYMKCTLSYRDFIYRLKNNVGIILLFSDSTVDNAVQVLRNITNNELTRDLINNRTVILPLSNNTLEGSQLCKRINLKSKRNDFPSILICFYKNERNFALIGDIKNVMDNMPNLSNTLLQAFDLFIEDKSLEPFTSTFSSIIDPPKNNRNKNKIINSNPYDYSENFNGPSNSNKIINDNIINNYNNINIINQPNNYINDYQNNNINNIINQPNNFINDYQYNNFINDFSNRNSNNNRKSNNNSYNLINDNNNYLSENLNKNSKVKRDSYSYMTDGEVLVKQENEIKKLENIVEKKRLEEEKKEKEKKEEEDKIKQEELMQKMQVESLVKLLPKEPSDEDPNKCTILFRFPDGEKVVERKFLKTDIVALLYLYIKSLGREIYTENNENHFSLIQSFPFKNLDEVQSNTLEQEGLYPNAMLQIKVFE